MARMKYKPKAKAKTGGKNPKKTRTMNYKPPKGRSK